MTDRMGFSEFVAAGVLSVLAPQGALPRPLSYKPVIGAYSPALICDFERVVYWLRDEGIIRFSRGLKGDDDCCWAFEDAVLTAKGLKLLRRPLGVLGKTSLGELVEGHEQRLLDIDFEVDEPDIRHAAYEGLLAALAY